MRTPENGEAIIASGLADLVSIVRGQIADPHLARKVAEGRPQDVRGCISCNQMCWGRRSRDYWISCLINPSAGREFEWGGDRFVGSPMSKDVLVVGAGPAGLEAARVAAERGHRVEIVEALPVVGGQFRLAGMQPRRGQILELMDWYERQFDKLGVRLRLNTFLEQQELADHPAEVVVIATGSLPDETGFQRWAPSEAALPGLEVGGMWSPEAVLRREARLGDAVVVYDEGGNWRGVGTAWALAEQGKRVTIVTPEPFVGKELSRTAADGVVRRRLGALVRADAGGTPTGPLAWKWSDGAVFPDRRGRGDCSLGSGHCHNEPGFRSVPRGVCGQGAPPYRRLRGAPVGGLCVS